jgi:hypothetical protein
LKNGARAGIRALARAATACAVIALAVGAGSSGSRAQSTDMGLAGTRAAAVRTAGAQLTAARAVTCQPPSLAGCFTEATMQAYLNDIIPLVERFYTATWASPLLPSHIYYIPLGSTAQSACIDSTGSSVQDSTAYDYCAADNSVYLGQATLWYLYSQAGDVAPAIGLAHEMGHEQQFNTGIPAPQTNAQTVNHEDQADCLSGAWFRYEIGQGNIQAEDYPSTAKYLQLIASAENDPNRDHGDLQQRLDSFLIGENQGAFGCNQFYPATPVITSA